MRRDTWKDRVRSDLAHAPVEPASEEFFRGIWDRIRHHEAEVVSSRPGPLVALGTACWRMAPVFASLLLLAALYGWFYPPAAPPQTSSVEWYALDPDRDPTEADLLFETIGAPFAEEFEVKQ